MVLLKVIRISWFMSVMRLVTRQFGTAMGDRGELVISGTLMITGIR